MSYPTDLDTITTTPSATSPLSTSHVDIHTELKTLLEAIQAKLGVNGSAVTSSIDYILKNASGGHEHDGTDSKKVSVGNLDPSALANSELLSTNAGSTAVVASGKSAPSGDIVGTSDNQTLSNKTMDTAAPNTIKINGNTLSATAGTATVTIPNSTDTLVGRNTADDMANKTFIAPEFQNYGGWIDADETWTYASVTTYTNSNTTYGGTFTISGDLTSKYEPGMFVKFTQTTAKYGVITKVSYSSPNTTITIFTGTDYTLANAAITSPYYSYVPALGFPKDRTKWRITLEDTTTREQSSPSQNTWYSPGSLSIDVPLGCWEAKYQVCGAAETASVLNIDAQISLSTSASSESDPTFTSYLRQTGASGDQLTSASAMREDTLTISADDTYYPIIRTTLTAKDYIRFYNAYSPLRIDFNCAYL